MTVLHADDWLTVYHGDCRAIMAELEAESVQCVVTSPPFYGLREYGLPPAVWAGGWEGTLGLEPSPAMYVEHILEVFRAIRRLLRPDGTVWLNLGDSYADRANRRSDGQSFRADRAEVVPGKRNNIGGQFAFKAKDRMMMPARVAIALQADGWWLRDEICWSKPNAMPSSVQDRTTPAHEMVYLLTKKARYFYDGAAIRETSIGTKATYRPGQVPRGWANGEGRGHDPQVGRYQPADKQAAAAASAPSGSATSRTMAGFNDRWEESEDAGTAPDGRNKRSVWTIPTQAYPDAHFATFPEKLVEPMILAGCPERACSECGRPWERVMAASEGDAYDMPVRMDGRPDGAERAKIGGGQKEWESYQRGATIGWRPQCGHDADHRPGVVLDPFAGSGTVGLVANRLGRRAILIDLSADYLNQAIKRIGEARGAGDGPAVDMPVPFADDGLWAEREAVS